VLLVLALGGATAVDGDGPEEAGRRFRYHESSGRCLDAAGREGYNAGSREALERTGEAECADLGGGAINLTYLRLARANLRGANLADALFYLGSITDSDLTGANLARTSGEMDYAGSRLRGATLAGADLTHSSLHGADLDGADLRGAGFSERTVLPFDRAEALRRGMVFGSAP
jgi:hypothetical protein